jgi:hypothetical protein
MDVLITTLGDGNGLIFAPRCDGECFNSRKEKGCDHPVGVVHAYVDQKLLKSNKIKSFN